ncbi:MAG: GcrA cell cycle regulator [Hyphomicrobiales bacterium]|nr:GcrA cell cycle regulator [Hyphomicrobiales bacterium]
MTWDDEHIRRLKEMHGEGLPASWIAATLGVSRNAVLGKIHRLGLSKPATRLRKVSGRRRQIRPRAVVAATPVIVKRSSIPLPTFAAADGSDIPPAQRKQLLDLRDEHCRYAFGHPGTRSFFFCGHPSASLVEHRPYCIVHARMSYSRQGSPERAVA